MKRMVVALCAVVGLYAPAMASARANCGALPAIDTYQIVGPSCVTARAVARAHARLLSMPGANPSNHHFLTVRGQRWHLTWHFQNKRGTVGGNPFTQIEYYRATHAGQIITFRTYGAN